VVALSGTPLDLGRYAVACVVVWAVTDRLVSRAAQRRAAAGARTTEERRPVRVTVDDAGVSMDDGEFAWTGRWSHFPWYRESEGHFLLGGRDGKPALWPIPKRAAATEADLALLADLLARHATRA
jgi:hypothetical protein